jgi:site-specific DNA-methyltransferase (adenine-specific)
LKQEYPNSKIGDVWVSLYLDEIVTMRDTDWIKLSKYHIIPESAEDVDYVPVIFRNGKADNTMKNNRKYTLFHEECFQND